MPIILNDIDTPTLDDFLDRKRHNLCLPGLAVAVVQGNRILYVQGFGNAAPERAMTSQTPMVIGSLSKSFTALAIMRLVEQGKLDLDAPVRDYIPWFCLADPRAAAAITLRYLLTHTSGISTYTGRELLGESGGKTIEQSVRELRTLKLTQPVGTMFQYSNTNYLIAGLVVEVVSGQSFASYIQEHIFAPLHMSYSHTNERDANDGGLATGYRWWFGVPVPGRVPFLDDALPAAFLACSVEDLARYLIACLDAGRSNQVLLSPAGFEELFRPQTVTATAGSSYALGWRRSLLNGVPVISHTGEVANYRAEMLLLPEQQLGIVVLANCNNGLIADVGLDRVVPGIVSILQGKQPITRKLTFKRFYLLLDLAAGSLSALQVLWTWRLLTTKRRSCSGAMLGALVDLAAPVAAVVFLPRIFDAPWSLLRIYVPDLVAWMRFVALPLAIIRLLLRIARFLVEGIR